MNLDLLRVREKLEKSERNMKMSRKEKVYAVYKGDKCLFIGNIDEIMQHFKVKRRTVYFWASATNKKWADTGKRTGIKQRKKECSGIKVAVKIEED